MSKKNSWTIFWLILVTIALIGQTTESDSTLSLQPLIRLIDGSNIDGDLFGEKGLMLAHWESALEGDEPEEAVQYTWIDSIFYAQLADHYAVVAENWLAERVDIREE